MTKVKPRVSTKKGAATKSIPTTKSAPTVLPSDGKENDQPTKLFEIHVATEEASRLAAKTPTAPAFEKYPNKRRPKSDDLAGFDIGFPIDIYLAAGYILATLSQKQSNTQQKPAFGEIDEGEALNYALPNQKDKAQFQRMIATLDKRYIFDLAHNALKYKSFFEEVLLEADFFARHPFSDDQNSLLMVYLVDLNNRNWSFRPDFESDVLSLYRDDFKQVEEAIKKSETKLHANVAKKRVAAQSPSINYFLPEALRAQEQNRGIVPISAWSTCPLEQITTSEEFMQKFTKVEEFNDILQPGEYKLDKNLDNVLHICGKQKDTIYRMNSVIERKLVIQEKSSVLAVDSCFKLLNALEPVDILLTNIGSGWTAIHLAIRLKKYHAEIKEQSRRKNFLYGTAASRPSTNLNLNDEKEKEEEESCKVYACFDGSDAALDTLSQRIEECGVSDYVEIIRTAFERLEHRDARLVKVKAVLISTECSRTSVADPIELLIQESQPDSNLSQLLNLKPQGNAKSADALASKHRLTLSQCMSGLCPAANAIVYLTRSVHASENENVVNECLKKQPNIPLKWKLSPPVVLLRPSDITASTGNFLQIPPSQHENGCFIAVLTRKTEQKDAAREMVKKAALQGLIIPEESSAMDQVAETGNSGPVQSRYMSNAARGPKGFGSNVNR